MVSAALGISHLFCTRSSLFQPPWQAPAHQNAVWNLLCVSGSRRGHLYRGVSPVWAGCEGCRCASSTFFGALGYGCTIMKKEPLQQKEQEARRTRRDKG